MTYANQGSVPSQRRRWTEPEATYGSPQSPGRDPGGDPFGRYPGGGHRDDGHSAGDHRGPEHPARPEPYGAGGPAGTGIPAAGGYGGNAYGGNGHGAGGPGTGGGYGSGSGGGYAGGSGGSGSGTGGQPGAAWTEPGPEQHDRAAAEIRNLVVDRLSQMNAQHALNAWEHRRKTPIGPHALAFFYLDVVESGGPARYVTPAAARLFLDGEDVAFLPELLYKMVGIGRRRLARGDDFDPLTTMARRQDEMSSRAQYIGVGVSSLETPNMGWAEVQQKAFGPLDIPGRGLALLTDGTRLVLERGDHAHGPMHVRSSHQLDLVPGIPSRRWTWLRDQVEPNSAEYWLHELHQTVLEGQRRMEERSRRRTAR